MSSLHYSKNTIPQIYFELKSSPARVSLSLELLNRKSSSQGSAGRQLNQALAQKSRGFRASSGK